MPYPVFGWQYHFFFGAAPKTHSMKWKTKRTGWNLADSKGLNCARKSYFEIKPNLEALFISCVVPLISSGSLCLMLSLILQGRGSAPQEAKEVEWQFGATKTFCQKATTFCFYFVSIQKPSKRVKTKWNFKVCVPFCLGGVIKGRLSSWLCVQTLNK